MSKRIKVTDTKLKFPKGVFTVDVGVNTAVAVWEGAIIPKTFLSTVRGTTVDTVRHQADFLLDLIYNYEPTEVLMESPEVWGDSLISITSAKRGNLGWLYMLCGAFIQACNTMDGCRTGKDRCIARLVTANEWKGQLSKEATAKRLFTMTGVSYKSEHVADAVAMGVALFNRKEWGLQ